MAPPGNTSSPGEHVRFELPPSLTNEPPGEELSSGNSLDDEILIEEDGDYFFDDEERLPFEYKKVLGKGLSAVVEKVQHTGTKEIFAKKAIRFPRGRKRVQAEDHYRNEVDIIRSLKSHRHVIQLFATYTTNREGCLLLQPAANEGNLEDYLENYSDAADSSNSRHPRRDEMTRVLEQAFGCLATGLAYIHRQGIRHKDIKPQNILIHEGFVIYTDFGISKDTNRDGECTTEGLPEFLTKKYSPPEVLENEKRNYAADVYSLGCVFIEMLSALGYSIDHEQEQGQHFSHVMDRIHAQLLSAEQPSKSCFLIETIVYMTSREPMNRPHAETLVTSICCHVGFFCSGCRPSHDIYLRWSGQEHMWYRIRYNTFTAQWEFLDWVAKSSNGTKIRATGRLVSGNHNVVETGTNVHYELLDHSFYVRDSNFFQEGRMFEILFTDAAGEYALNAVTDYNSVLSRVSYSDHVLGNSQVRRFIIVKRKREHCYAVPVFTYGGRGTLKPGVIPDEHAIAYTYGYQPQLLPEEKELRKSPICIVTGKVPLSTASRIYFGIHHPIQYNVKVKDLGYVHSEWLPAFLGYWNQENGVDTLQMADVTNEAATSGL